MRTGLGGLLDRVTGRYRQHRDQNEREAWQALQRDREQRQRLIQDQLAERRQLQLRIAQERNAHHERVAELHRDLARQLQADRTLQKSERQLWLEDQQRSAERERQEWAQAQEQIRDEERARWLAEQQSHVRHAEPEPGEDRLRTLLDQQRSVITPPFNDRAAGHSPHHDAPSSDGQASEPDNGPCISP